MSDTFKLGQARSNKDSRPLFDILVRARARNSLIVGEGSMAAVNSIAKDNVECRVCFEPFDTKDKLPMVMSCGHSLCAICSTKFTFVAGLPNTYNCPVCRQKPSTEPQKNYDMIAFMETMQVVKKREESQAQEIQTQKTTNGRLTKENACLIDQIAKEKENHKIITENLNAKVNWLEMAQKDLDSEYKLKIEQMLIEEETKLQDKTATIRKLENDRNKYYLELQEKEKLFENLKKESKNKTTMADTLVRTLEMRINQLEFEKNGIEDDCYAIAEVLKAEVASLSEDKRLLSVQLEDMKVSADDTRNSLFCEIENEVKLQKKFIDYQRTFILLVFISLLLACLVGVFWRQSITADNDSDELRRAMDDLLKRQVQTSPISRNEVGTGVCVFGDAENCTAHK